MNCKCPRRDAMGCDCSCHDLIVGAQVIFRENDEHPRVLGVISRLWNNGKYATIISDGRTFVRLRKSVIRCG